MKKKYINTEKVTFNLFRLILFAIIPLTIINGSATAANVDRVKSSDGEITIHPVMHASFVITTDKISVFVDPVGDVELYKSFRKPDLILITDIHGDHLGPETIRAIKKETTIIVGPKAATEKLAGIEVIQNGEKAVKAGIHIEAVPMYNTTKERMKFHPPGRGNGYVLSLNGKRLYISGDTEDIPEMKKLKNIDIAFICMNLPYTMDESVAAAAVLAFKPGIVYPYHFRGKKEGQPFFHDVNKFKQLVSVNNLIDVRLLSWY